MNDPLQLDEDLFRQLLDSLEVHVLVVDELLHIRYVNFTADGYRVEDVLGADATKFVHPDYREWHRERLTRALEEGRPQTFGVPGRGDPDERQWYSGRASPLQRDEETVGLVIVMKNVTELRRAQRQADDLKRLLPVCPWCNEKVRVGSDEWVTFEDYLLSREDLHVSHGMCPDCGQDMISDPRRPKQSS